MYLLLLKFFSKKEKENVAIKVIWVYIQGNVSNYLRSWEFLGENEQMSVSKKKKSRILSNFLN